MGDYLFYGSEDAFFLKGTNSLRAESHCYLLAINNECFLLEVWFKNSVSATQRKAHIVSELYSFTG